MYQPKDFSRLLGTAGFSDALLKNHFTLYEGYVKNTNTLLERLQALHTEKKTGPGEFAELKRRLGWEWNGMRLHELYFGNMEQGGIVLEETEEIHQKITKTFGSFDAWRADFVATGSLRGIGWAVLAYDREADTLLNVWINEHDVGHLAGATPLLIMDVFEHAFMLDYGLKRADYVEAFMQAVDWSVVNERLMNASA